MNRRKVMYHTNKLAREWLFKNGFDFVWFKPHMDQRKAKHKEFFYTKNGNFYANDIYNLFDGICFSKYGILTFFQTSTTNYHPEQKYIEFMQNKLGFRVIMIKSVKKKGRWQIHTKELTRSSIILNTSIKKSAIVN